MTSEHLNEVENIKKERDHYKTACMKMVDEVTQILGEALFGPTPPDAPGPVWAMDTPETRAGYAADRIARLQAKLERARALCLAGHDAAYDLAADVLAIIDEGSEG